MSKRNRRKKRIKINIRGVLFLIMTALFIVVLFTGTIKFIGTITKPQTTTETSIDTNESEIIDETEPTESTIPEVDYDFFSGIYSQEAILIDAEDGTILKSFNGNDQAYPASVTKMMTVLVAIEECVDLTATYSMPQEIYDYLFYQDLSTAGFECNEQVQIIDLLYGVMLRSGAECCLGTANYIAGSEAEFVTLMNAKAEELGMTNTHFMNCTGEHDDNHYSSVYDMAILLKAGLDNPTFRQIISTNYYVSASTNVHPAGITMYSTFSQNLLNYDAGGATMIGAKTGYTSQAGQCLASFCEIDGHEYILVTFGAFPPENSDVYAGHLHVDDAITVYSRLYLYLHNGNTPTPVPTEAT